MNRFNCLVVRNIRKEIRHPASIILAVVLPIIILIVLRAVFMHMSFSENTKIFSNEFFVGRGCVISYCFSTLVIMNMIMTDKRTKFLDRLRTTPIKKYTYYLSFAVSIFPVMLLQTIISMIISVGFGLNNAIRILLVPIYMLPAMAFFISIGILFGMLFKNFVESTIVWFLLLCVFLTLGAIVLPIDNIYKSHGTEGDVYSPLQIVSYTLPFIHLSNLPTGLFDPMKYGPTIFNGSYKFVYPFTYVPIIWTGLISLAIGLLCKFNHKM